MTNRCTDEGALRLRVINNPKPGDKLASRSAARHKTRRVTDRTLGGDVHYCWDERSNYRDRCTLLEWQEFCAYARIIKVAK
jgi:hypothetical protein